MERAITGLMLPQQMVGAWRKEEGRRRKEEVGEEGGRGERAGPPEPEWMGKRYVWKL
jgi:hypothetical protein